MDEEIDDDWFCNGIITLVKEKGEVFVTFLLPEMEKDVRKY